jgi:uncharacterized protein YsxB (DUF464 family)
MGKFDVSAALAGVCRLVVATSPARHAAVTIDGVLVASVGEPGPDTTALPLPTDNGTVAALTVSGDADPDALDQHVLVATALVQAAETIDHLDRALANQPVIEQAKGILMAAHRTTDPEAFRMLVENSQATNRKLRLVAEEFVDGATR